MLSEAHAHAVQALDFVSLLLTKDLPTQAKGTLNPTLQGVVPMGSLGMDKLAASRYTEQEKTDHTRVAKAWRVKSLNKSVDSILESATRLEKEIEKETRYWEEILSIDDAGWALCQLPHEKHTLGVRFGFSECRFFLADVCGPY
jgi:mediator of RNA polymerase II transcription subunit 17